MDFDLGKVVGEMVVKQGFSEDSFTNESSYAGCKGWYYKDLTEASENVYQLTICDEQGRAVTDCLLGDGAEISWKADYSANFCGTILFTNRSTGTVQVTLYAALPDNWIPSVHQYDYDPSAVKPGRGYLWSPLNPSLGKVIIGDGAVGFGCGNKANELGGFSCGRNNLVDGRYGFSSGDGNKVGYAAHAEGQGNEATELYSHAEGKTTKAKHKYSHAEGLGTETGANGQHVQGKYNEKLEGQYVDIVGWGSSTNKQNIYVLDSDGNLYLKGDVYVKATGKNGITNPKKIEDEVFVIKRTSGTAIDKTYAEIQAAADAGRPIILVASKTVYILDLVNNGVYYFSSIQYQRGEGTTFTGIAARRFAINSSGVLTDSNPSIRRIMPNPPDNTGTYTLKCVAGIPKWE